VRKAVDSERWALKAVAREERTLRSEAFLREKLAELKEQYEVTQKETVGNQSARELTLRSLKKPINQLTEEIARYEAHVGGAR
jgi:hypothetical protein